MSEKRAPVLCFASPRGDLQALVTEACWLLKLPSEQLAEHGDTIATAYEAVRDIPLDRGEPPPLCKLPPETPDVHEWRVARWGLGDAVRQALKVTAEAGEVADAAVKRDEGRAGEWTQNLHDEMADVVIALHALAGVEGVDLDVLVAKRWHGNVSKRGADLADGGTS